MMFSQLAPVVNAEGDQTNHPDSSNQSVGIDLSDLSDQPESNNHPPVINQQDSSNQQPTYQPQATNQPNLTGKLLKGAAALGLVSFSFHTQGETQSWYDVKTDAQGSFTAVVPDGSYLIEGIWLDQEKKWYPIQHEFEVAGSASLEINIQPGNVMGQVLNEGAPVADVLINVYTVNTSEKSWYHATTNKNGQFYLNLADGDYQIDGLWLESEKKWYQKPTTFTIQNGQMQGQDSLTFHIGLSKIFGTVTKEGAPLPNEVFSIVKIDGDEQWFNATTDSKGNFSFELPDGQYQLEGVWVAAENKWYPLQLTFKVVNGALESSTSLEIEITAKKTGNVTGTLSQDNLPVPNVWFSAHTVHGEIKWFDANTKDNGQFYFQLPDGDYQIDGIWLPDESKWYVLNRTFTVTDGKLVGHAQLDIVLSDNINFHISGTVINGTEPVVGVEVNAYSTVDGMEKWYSTTTDNQGSFTLSIPNGTYTIEGIWHFQQSKWYERKTIFTVENGQLLDGPLTLDLQAPTKKNVEGVLTKGSKPLAHVTFSTYSNVDGDIKWFDAKSDENGQFGFTLPDGNYQIDGIWVSEESYWYEKKINFTVTNGSLQGASNLAIDVLATEQLISGTLVKGTEKLANITFSFYSVGANQVWYDTTTNSEGVFTIPHLSDGTYVIEGVWLQDEAKWYELHYSFEVHNGQVQGDLLIDILKKAETNIDGTVQDVHGPVADVQVSIYTEGSNENGMAFYTNSQGQFKATLADGSYQVRYLFFKSSQTALVQTISFQVEAGKLYLNGKQSETLDITVPNENVFGSITRDGAPIIDAQVLVSTGAPDEHFLHAAISDENGAFTLRLPDGSYTVLGIFLAGEFYEVQVPFVVKNGVATDELELALDSIFTISGQIVDSDGLPVVDTDVVVSNEDESIIQLATTDDNGMFVFELPNGSYSIFQIGDVESGFTELDYSFVIENGKIFENGMEKESLLITLPRAENVNGVITGEDPSLLDGMASIRSRGEQGVWYRPTLKQGHFTVDLPDGEYTFIGVTIGQELSVFNQHFQVMNGKLLVDGLHQPSLQAELPPNNFALSFSGVNQEEDELHLSIRPLPAEDFYIGFVPDGSLDLRLADGEYEIYRVVANGTTYNVNIVFQVIGGELYQKGSRVQTILVDITPITFQGFLKNEDGTPVANADVNIRNTSGHDFVATSNQDGYFAFQLADGTYNLRELYLKETNERLSLSGSVAITNGKSYIDGELFTYLNIPLPKITVKGILYDGGKPYANAHMSLFTNNPIRSYSLKTNMNGEFFARVPDGNYTIPGFSNLETEDSGTLNFSFQVVDGKMVYQGVQRTVLNVNCPPKTFNVVLKNGTKPIANAHMFIDNKSNPGYGYSIKTDSEGKFSLRAADGEYFIKETTSNGVLYTLNQTIFVTNGTTNPNPFVIDVSIPRTVSGNFKGVVTDGLEKFAFAQVEVSGNAWVRTTSTNSNGEFGIQLEDGQFTIRYVKTADGEFYQNIQFEVKDGKAYIDGVEKTSFVLEIPPKTLKGVVTDGTSTPIEGAIIEFTQEGPNWYSGRSVKTDVDGQFYSRLKDGTYFIENVELHGQTFSFYKTYFSIKNQELYNANGEKITSLELKIPKVNLKGTVSIDGAPLASAYLELFSTLRIYTNDKGQFEYRLHDGSYQIREIGHYGQTISYSVFQPFTIKDGNMYVNNQPIDTLDFSVPKEMLIGTVQSNGTPLSGAKVEVQRLENGATYYIDQTTAKGEMFKRLPDGTFVINEVTSNGTFPIFKTFKISGGNLVGEPLLIDINQKTTLSTITGSFEDNGQPVKNVTLKIYRDGQLYSVPTDADGTFNFDGVDGRYTFQSYLDSSGSEVSLSLWGIYFIVVNGKVVFEGQTVTTVPLTLPQPTAAIQVVDKGVPIMNRNVTVEFSSGLKVTAKTDQDGKIFVKLPQGRYFINKISFYLKSEVVANMTKQIDVEDVTKLTDFPVDLSDSSFLNGKGIVRILDEKGAPAAEYATVTYRELEYNNTYSIRTNRLGEVHFDQPKGSYKITGISMSDVGGQDFIGLDVPFTFEYGKFTVNGIQSDTLDVVLPPVNVKGILLDEAGAPLAGVELPHSGSGYVRVTTNQDGEFNLRLKDGDYGISSIYVNSETRKVNFSYSVVNGKPMVNGVEQEKLTIQLSSINFTGTAKLNGTLATYATMKIKQKNSAGEYVEKYTAFINTDGIFKESIPNGEYLISTIENYSLGKHYIGYRFSIQDGVVMVDGEKKPQLNLVFSTGVVTGKLFLYGQPAVEFSIKLHAKRNDVLDVMDAYVGTMGSFTSRLADGEYEIQAVTYKGQTYSVNQKIVVTNGSFQPSPLMVELSGTNKSAVVNGKLLDNGKAPGQGSSLTIRNKYMTKPDYQVPVDAEGNFQVELPDGAYDVVGMKVLNTSVVMPLTTFTFEVVNGELKVKGEATDTLDLNLPAPTTIIISRAGTRLGGAEVKVALSPGNVYKYMYTDQNGTIKLRLTDGRYFIDRISHNGSNFYKYYNFEITNGQVIVDGVQKPYFEVVLP
jgi:uncharacterized GH25 family protein